MKSAMLAMVFVLAAAGAVEIPLPPAEEATPSIPQIDDAVVSLGAAVKAPSIEEPKSVVVQLNFPRIPVVEEIPGAPGNRAIQAPSLDPPVVQTVKTAFPKLPAAEQSVAVLSDRPPQTPNLEPPVAQTVKTAFPKLPAAEQSVAVLGDRPPQMPKVTTPVAESVALSFPRPPMVAHSPLATPRDTPGLQAFLAPTEADRREILAVEQLRYAADRRHRGLPDEFMLGGWVGGAKVPRDEYPRLIWVVQAGREADAKFLDQYPEVRFIVTDEVPAAILSFRWLRLIDRDSCVAVVLGINQCRWSRPESLAVTAQDLLEKRDYLKNLTDAPILLAVSRVNAREQVNCQWMKAFASSAPWDGYAFVGFSTFRGLREMGRSKICREAAVPEDRSAVVFHWHDVATRRGADEDLARTRQVWQANAGPLVKKLLADGWKGFLMDLFTPEQLWTRMEYLQPEVEKAR